MFNNLSGVTFWKWNQQESVQYQTIIYTAWFDIIIWYLFAMSSLNIELFILWRFYKHSGKVIITIGTLKTSCQGHYWNKWLECLRITNIQERFTTTLWFSKDNYYKCEEVQIRIRILFLNVTENVFHHFVSLISKLSLWVRLLISFRY